MANYGIKISKSGKNVLNAKEIELIISSELSGLKLKAKGSFSATLPAGVQYEDVKIANLGLDPNIPYFFFVYGNGVQGTADPPEADPDPSYKTIYPLVTGMIDLFPYLKDGDLWLEIFCGTIAYVADYDRTWNGVYFVFYNPYEYG